MPDHDRGVGPPPATGRPDLRPRRAAAPGGGGEPVLADAGDGVLDPDLVAGAVRAALAPAAEGVRAYLDLGARLDVVSALVALPGAVAWRSVHATRDRPWLLALGEDPADVCACLVELASSTGRPEGLTVPRATFPRLPRWLRPVEHWEWDWWWTRRPPAPRPGEGQVVDLALDDPRIAALLAVASPDAMARPGDPRIRRWAGIEAPAARTTDGAARPPGGPAPDRAGTVPAPPPGRAGHGAQAHPLVAVAAVTTMRPGIPHLGSVATDPGWRGLGLARDLCARLTREELSAGAPAVTLGMHAANRSARLVYGELGYRVGYRWASGRLVPARHQGH